MGEPVLLLHGQPGSARDWDPLRAALGDHASTVAITRPGWDGTGSAADLAGNAHAAAAALHAEGVDRAIVVGHSFGAAVAVELALAHPERVAALVLVAPSANTASLYRLDHVMAAPIAGELGALMTLGGAGMALTARRVRRRAADELAVDESYLLHAARLLRAPKTWRAFAAEQRVLVRELPALESRLGRVTAPTHIVLGQADWVVPVASARLLAEQIPDAQITLLPRGGHLIPQQCPRELGEVIAEVSAGVPRAPAARG